MNARNRFLWICLVFGLVGLVPGMAPEARGWSGSMTVSPTTAISGTTMTYSVTIENTFAETIGIYSLFVHFDWQATDVGYSLLDTSDPISIAVGNTRTFTASIPVPTGIPTDTTHLTEVTVDATTPGLFGGWSGFDRHTHTYTVNLYVSAAPTPGTGGPGTDALAGMGIGLGVLILIIVVVIVVAAVAMRGRSGGPTPPPAFYAGAPVQPPMQSLQTQSAPSIRCPTCGAVATGAFCQTCGHKL